MTVGDTVGYQCSTNKCNIYHVEDMQALVSNQYEKHPTPGQRLRPPLWFVCLHEVMAYRSYSMPHILQILHPCCHFHEKKNIEKHREVYSEENKYCSLFFYRIVIYHKASINWPSKMAKMAIKRVMLEPDIYATVTSEHLICSLSLSWVHLQCIKDIQPWSDKIQPKWVAKLQPS